MPPSRRRRICSSSPPVAPRGALVPSFHRGSATSPAPSLLALASVSLVSSHLMYVLDPTAEADPQPVSRASRLDSLHNRRIGLLSNGKTAVAPLFDYLESLLRQEWKARDVLRLTKANYSAPAEPDLIREL